MNYNWIHYFTMNVFIQRILLLSMGIWLIYMSSDSIHKLHYAKDREKQSSFFSLEVCLEYISVPLMVFFWERATLASGAEFQDVLCPHSFKGKSITLLVWWTELVKSHPYIPSLQEKAFLWQWMKTKGKDERNHVLKETKRAVKKGVQMWKAGGKGTFYLEWD